MTEQQQIDFVRQLIQELRQYKQTYPDADWNDLVGYLVGVTGRLEYALNERNK